jgi:very-short-patch-repair endonuclease
VIAMPHAIVSDAKKKRAKTLRRDMTGAERKLWYALRAHRFDGLGFRRQVPPGRYILDFVCHDRGLVVEVDGGQHFSASHSARDAVRDRWLQTQGYRVMRVPNNEVLCNLEGVLEYILSAAADSPLPPCGGARAPLRRAEGGRAQILKSRLTPLPTLPHKGGGVFAAPYAQDDESLKDYESQK